MARAAEWPDAAEAFARSVGFWIRAYPRRWRAVRGSELAGLLVDLAAPGARGVGARTAFDLVLGGLATRWRGRPPLHVWLLYRLFDRRIPSGYRGWAQDDIHGVTFPVRRALGYGWWWFGWMLTQAEWSTTLALLGVGYLAVASVAWPDYVRRQHLLKHVAPQPGEPLVEGGLVTRPVPRRRLAAGVALRLFAGACAVVAVAGSVTTLLAPRGMWAHGVAASPAGLEIGEGPITDRTPAVAGLLLCAVLGLWGARLVSRRLRHRLAAPVHQPYRVMSTRPKWSGVGGLVVLVGGLLAWMGMEVRGDLALFAGPFLAGIALTLLPGTLVAIALVGRVAAQDAGGSHDRATHPATLGTTLTTTLTGADVWHMAVEDRAPFEDTPLPALHPVDGTVDAAATMPPRRLGDPPFALR